MRIGIYAETANDDRPTGIGRHVALLLSALAKADSSNEYLLYYAAPFGRADSGLRNCPPQANFRPRPVRVPAGWQWSRPRLWWNYWLPRALKRDRLDVFHGPNHFLPKHDRCGRIVTIHDLAYFHMPVHGDGADDLLRNWTRLACHRADGVIALSENTRVDLTKLGVPPERVHVIYGGGNIVPEEQIAYHRTDELRASLGLPARFVLYVGALQPRKNVPFLVRAFAQIKAGGQLPHKLLLAGPPEEATVNEVRRLSRELDVEADVIVTGYLADWQIPLLYKLADVFVLPTRYEGFTLVTLEAMAYGAPVVATDTSSIREGVGAAALLTREGDVDELAAAIRRILDDKSLRAELTRRGRDQAAKFSWDRNARQTLELYEDVQRGRSRAAGRLCGAAGPGV